MGESYHFSYANNLHGNPRPVEKPLGLEFNSTDILEKIHLGFFTLTVMSSNGLTASVLFLIGLPTFSSVALL